MIQITKKIVLRTLVTLVALAGLFLTTGVVEAAAIATDKNDVLSYAQFRDSILPPPSFESNNGFYRMWTLTEPADVDIESEEVLRLYRGMQDPKMDNEKYIKQWKDGKNCWKAGKKNDSYFASFLTKRRELLKKYGLFDTYYNCESPQQWTESILKQKQGIHELQSLYGTALERYRKMLESEVFEDFTNATPGTTVPNLLAYLTAGRAYNAVHMLSALEGNWKSGVTRILDNIDFNKRVVKTARTLILNLVAKAVTREAVLSLATLMNEPEFPKALYDVVIERMPRITPDEYGSRIPYLLEGFFMMSSMGEDTSLFQTNRPQFYYGYFFTKLVESERTPPYKWDNDPYQIKVVGDKLCWVAKPGEKTPSSDRYDTKLLSNLLTTMYKSYALKSIYDMTRISAEVHRAYTPDKSMQEILNGLEVYNTWVDPCSGKPYKWNSAKQVLYSFSTDRDDDGGEYRKNTVDTDVNLALIPFIK